ncbi:MAG: glycosyltransferase 87 family protein [Vicinamibacterales bacterium]
MRAVGARWVPRRHRLLWFAVAILAAYAAAKLGSEFYRLVWDTGRTGAMDLKLRHEEVHLWFAGGPVYSTLPLAVYPPASYVMLWPLVGWTAFGASRWLWALASLAALVALSPMFVRLSGATHTNERLLVALLPLSLNAAGVGVGSGQFSVIVIPLAVGAVMLTARPSRGWIVDTCAAALVIASLVKPTMSVPFLWLMLFANNGWRPLSIAGAGYVGLTLLGASFQADGLVTLLSGWLVNAVAASQFGYGDVQSWLGELGLTRWSLAASLTVLGGLGPWLFRHRCADLCVRLGVVALIARFWAYHRMQDDVLIALPMVALYRLARSPLASANDDSRRAWAGILLVVTIVVMMTPARFGLRVSPLMPLFNITHTVVWLGLLAFLIRSIAMASRQDR